MTGVDKSTIESLKKDFKSLIEKYNLQVERQEQYNGVDEWAGYCYYFLVDGKPYYSEEIPEIFEDLLK